MVQRIPVAPDHSQGREAVDQLHDRMVLELELPGQGPDRGKLVGRQAFDREEQLVLLGLQAGLPGRIFAEGHEAADEMSEMRQVLVIWLA
jgi:hypothetical protein